MNELSYWNGELTSGRELSVSVLDAGFVQGATVSEQFRTFSGKLFALEEHFLRLRRSLEILGLDRIDLDHLRAEAEVIASHNHSLLQPGDDLGLTIFVTPGSPPFTVHGGDAEKSVVMFTTPLPFHRWADKYTAGEALIVSSVRQIPSCCWPVELKCRSRMHYFLADREAQQTDPAARALLLDQDGFVSEASTASIVAYGEAEGFIAPPYEKVLPSISIGVVKGIAESIGKRFTHRDMMVDDLHNADEVFLTSTSPCLLPVTRIDGKRVGNGTAGPMFQALIRKWSQQVETEIVAQAQRFAHRD